MGDHYATCRPENCPQCGQALGHCEHTRRPDHTNLRPQGRYWKVMRAGSAVRPEEMPKHTEGFDR